MIEFLVLAGAAVARGVVACTGIPLLPFNRAWTWDRYKAFWRGQMPMDGF